MRKMSAERGDKREKNHINIGIIPTHNIVYIQVVGTYK